MLGVGRGHMRVDFEILSVIGQTNGKDLRGQARGQRIVPAVQEDGDRYVFGRNELQDASGSAHADLVPAGRVAPPRSP